MAVESKALTMDQWAMESRDEVQRGLVESILTPHNVMGDLMLVNRNDLKTSTLRMTTTSYDANGYTGWVDMNEIPGVYEASFEDFGESLYLYGNRLQIHKRFLAQKNWINNPIEARFEVWKDDMIRDFNIKFFNNDPADAVNGNRKAITGLRARFAAGSPYGTPSVNKINCSGVDFSSISATTLAQFGYYVDLGLALMGDPDGEQTTMYTNHVVKARLNQGAKLAGAGSGFSMVKDAFGRSISTWKDGCLKIRDVGFRRDQTTPILRNNESSAGVDDESGTYTSIFMVKHGKNGLKGWQPGLPHLQHLGLSKEDGTMHNYIMDGGVGLHQTTQQCIVWLHNIKVLP